LTIAHKISCKGARGRHDMPPPRPASGEVTRYVMYAYG